MRPGTPVPVMVLTGLLDEQPGGGTASDAHSNGAIQTVALVGEHPISLRDLETFLDLLSRAAGPKLIRLTGLVALADDPGRPLVLQPGRPALYPLQRLVAWPSQDRRTRMIAIAHDLDPATLKRLFASVTSPWPDRMRMHVAMAASAALVVVLVVGIAFAVHVNGRTTVQASSTPAWTQDRGF
jgi:Cobalamin synthesis protein cobW C-terminal domain